MADGNDLDNVGNGESSTGMDIQQLKWLRRHFILFSVALTMSMSVSTTALAAEGAPKTVLVMGDSLSAEYGLPRGTGWVALLAERLRTEKLEASIVNASISGDTTSGGRSRLGALLARYQPEVVIIELGGNDALRGMPLGQTEDNLTAMLLAAQQSGAKVLLLGMEVPPNYGRDYATRFTGLFDKVAKTHKAALVPLMLKGIADDPDPTRWFQPDRIHPLAQAHPIILNNLWPALKKLLKPLGSTHP
jgi:acyl-CoA thioesterase I